MMTFANTSEIAFNDAVNFFFAHNPKNPHWILVALYLRHEHKLRIVENYNGDDACIIAPVWDYEYATITAFADRFESGELKNICIIGDIADDPALLKIIREFEQHAEQQEAPNSHSRLFHSLRQWEPSFLLETAQKLLNIDDEWLNSNFTNVFDNCIARLFSKQDGGLILQPKEISNLGAALLGDVNGTVFNPYAGIGSYALSLKGSFEYIGEEITPLYAAIGNIRLKANHINGKIEVADSVVGLDKKEGIDAVIATPPFGLRLEDIHQRHGQFPSHDSFLLHWLSERDCNSVAICRAGICLGSFSGRILRKELVDKQCIDKIILLPANIFPMTAVSTVIFVLNKNHNHKGFVRFIDASNCFVGDIRKRVVNVDAILQMANTDSEKSVLVSYDEIAKKDFSLLPAQYMPVVAPQRSGELVRLDEIGSFERNRVREAVNNGLFATVRTLSNVNIAKIYTPEDFSESEIPQVAIKITKPCILFPEMRSLCGICVNPMNKTLYVRSFGLCFVYDPAKVNPQYIALQLREDYVQAQIGATVSFNVSRDIISNAKILLPSLAEQEKYVASYQNELISKLGLQIENSRDREFEDFERNMRIRRHSLGNKLQSIMPAAQLLRDFVARQDQPFSKDTIVGKRSYTTLMGMVDRLYSNLQRVEDLVDKFTEVEEFGKAEIIDLNDFCAEYARNAIGGNYEIVCFGKSVITSDSDDDIQESPDLHIRFSKRDFEFVFENIISNAKRHGFTDQQRKDYVIRIDFNNFIDTDGSEKVYIRFFNNGNRLPSGMNPQKVFDWGVGNGSGLGGWHIKRIVEHFGGTISFQEIENSIDGFTVEYEIIVPLINIDE